MTLQHTVRLWREARLDFFLWRAGAGVCTKLLAAAALACFTGLMAQVRIFPPWSPVPVTGQTVAVLLSGAILGRWGAASQFIYMAAGFFGVPWFSWFQGPAVLTGPTAGYLLGFLLASFTVGHFLDRSERARHYPYILGIMLAANFFLILLPGIIGLRAWLAATSSEPVSLHRLLVMGLYPFLPGAVVKSVIAAGLAHAVVPKLNVRNRNL